MLSWLIVLCLLAISFCPAAPLAAVAARSALEFVAYPAAPTIFSQGHGRGEYAGLPEGPDQRDDAGAGTHQMQPPDGLRGLQGRGRA